MNNSNTKPEKVQYILRPLFTILQDDALWKSFMAYAKNIRADAVMAFSTHLEANHPSLESLRERLPLMAKRFAEVRAAGMSPMVNYYVTLGHANMLPAEHAKAFTDMVDGKGRVEHGCPCPLCPEFRSYIYGAYKLFASLDVDAVWIDDDFRLFGRAQTDSFLCFCDRHMEAFSNRMGVAYGRDEINEALRKDPLGCTPVELQLRRDWRAFQEDILVEFGVLLREACESANPDIQMGLMTNTIEMMLRHGRHLDAEIKALRTKNKPEPHIRLGGASYTDEHLPGILDRCVTFDALAAMITEPSQLSSEIEQFPWTIGGKSARALALELYVLSISFSPRLTLSINDGFLGFDDVSGNYQKTLGPLKAYLQAVSNAVSGKVRRGTSLPFPNEPDVIAGMDLSDEPSMRFNHSLTRIGIPVAPGSHTPTLITMKEAMAYPEETLTSWLEKGTVITSEAYYHLCKRGILRNSPIRVEKGDMSHRTTVERIVAPHAPDWLRNKDVIAWLYMPMHSEYILSAEEGAEEWSEIYDNLGNRQSSGVVVTREPYPMVVVPHTGGLLKETGRQWLYQQIMSYLTVGEFPAMVEFGVNIYPVWWEDDKEVLLGLANFSLETYPSLALWIPTRRKLAKVEQLSREGVWTEADASVTEHPDGGVRLTLQGNSVPDHASFETYRFIF
ncbi:hypothetical protein [Paenibacillus agaridevorans]|uniref:hypothetical protein n=1 Tax=Paenibacillus agaridevorans TaxID=171404 RepID=UPI001BE46AAE|nr:hypothetical protein [Paenibacillus agaridevorans]